MPKQIYVRGHYRRSRKQGPPLWVILVAIALLFVIFVAYYPTSLYMLAGLVIIASCVFLVTRIQKRRMSNIPDNRSAMQSRYIPEDMKRFVMRRDNYQCRSCGSELYPEIDHIIPFSLGGPTHPDNLQVLCRGCNSQKRALVSYYGQ